MNRLIRGPVVLAVALVALSCKGDPTSSLRNGVEQLIADPGALFIQPDSTKLIIVGAVDEQGNQIQAHFTVGTVSPGLTVVVDPAFDLVYNDAGVLVKPEKATREQFIVTATATSGSLSFVVNGGGKDITIPVRVLATSFPATFSNATPAVQDTVTVTAGAGVTFDPAATVAFGGTEAFITDRAVDGTSITFVPVPGSTSGPATVDGVLFDYLGTLALSVPSDASLTVPAYAGTSATTTSPTIAVPPTGANSTYILSGDLSGTDITLDGGLGAAYYQFTLAAPASFKLTVDWTNDADVDFALCPNTACTGASYAGATAAHPEVGTYVNRPAGTYYLAVILFDGDAPPYVKLDILGQ